MTGARAVAQTKMTIAQRAQVDGITADVTCTGRFYDFLEKRAGAWGIVRRQPIYEKDRLDPVDPGARLTLDPGGWLNSRPGTGTWPTCSPSWASGSRPGCRGCAGRRWNGCTRRAGTGAAGPPRPGTLPPRG